MADEKSGIRTALPWLALAAGVGGLAYATTRPGAKKAAPASAAGEGSAAKKRRRKKKKAPTEKKPAGPYALFVQEQMPLLKAKGMDGGKAMAEIGRLWKAKQGKA